MIVLLNKNFYELIQCRKNAGNILMVTPCSTRLNCTRCSELTTFLQVQPSTTINQKLSIYQIRISVLCFYECRYDKDVSVARRSAVKRRRRTLSALTPKKSITELLSSFVKVVFISPRTLSMKLKL